MSVYFRFGIYCTTFAAASQTFGVSLKGVRLHHGVEQQVYFRNCSKEEAPCAMQHWWSGGTFPGYALTRVRYYVDGQSEDPLDLPLGLAHGQADHTEDNGPWSAGTLFGKSGVGLHSGAGDAGSGFFNTYLIPFATSVNVTVELGGGTQGAGDYFWLILRGRTKARLVLPGGEPLPASARLRSYETRQAGLAAYAELSLFNSSAQNGAVLVTTLAVQSPASSYVFLEGMIRAYPPANATPPDHNGYFANVGALVAGDDVAVANFTSLSAAEHACDSTPGCEGFTYEGEEEPTPTEPAKCYLKKEIRLNGDSAWRTYTKVRQPGGPQSWLVSSGTEDYFLGTFYFDKGQYFLPLAGLTTLCPQPHDGAPRGASPGCQPSPDGTVSFSAYRLHAGVDPLVFEGGIRLTWRNGEPGHGGAEAKAINASSLVLVYEW